MPSRTLNAARTMALVFEVATGKAPKAELVYWGSPAMNVFVCNQTVTPLAAKRSARSRWAARLA